MTEVFRTFALERRVAVWECAVACAAEKEAVATVTPLVVVIAVAADVVALSRAHAPVFCEAVAPRWWRCHRFVSLQTTLGWLFLLNGARWKYVDVSIDKRH